MKKVILFHPIICNIINEKGGRFMREGIIPTIVGSAVAATGATMIRRNPVVAYGILGFGAAHILLGSIDLFLNRSRRA
jgi:hypothetical protein